MSILLILLIVVVVLLLLPQLDARTKQILTVVAPVVLLVWLLGGFAGSPSHGRWWG